MSRGRRHAPRSVKQRELTRSIERAGSRRAARRDLITRNAIMQRQPDGEALVWWCVASNGQPKPGYRTEATAARVAAMLLLYGDVAALSPYRCPVRGPNAIQGEHWHLTSKGLTPTAKRDRVEPTTKEGNTT